MLFRFTLRNFFFEYESVAVCGKFANTFALNPHCLSLSHAPRLGRESLHFHDAGEHVQFRRSIRDRAQTELSAEVGYRNGGRGDFETVRLVRHVCGYSPVMQEGFVV